MSYSLHIPRGRHGFTLVELLVVIGIIALLISILLPSLNKARQQATLVDCSARLRQIGQAVHLYASTNKGYLPSSDFGGYGYTSVKREDLVLASTLSKMLGVKDPWFEDWSPVFDDKDTNGRGSQSNPNQRAANHYAFNGRLFPDATWVAGIRMLPMSRVKRSQEVVAAWDGQLNQPDDWWWGNNAFKNSLSMANEAGGWMYYESQHLSFGAISYYNYNQPVGRSNLHPGRSGTVDFRHQKNTAANALFLDGHVESKKYKELQVKDFSFDRGETP